MKTSHLAPIEQPPTLWMKVAYAWSRRSFGKVIAPMKIIYARVPPLASLAQKIVQTHRKISLEPALQLLVQVKVSQLNGCAFCEDISLVQALQKRIGRERFRDLNEYANSDTYTQREKAALAFVQEATTNRRVSEETWRLVQAQFSEVEIVELTWLNAAENYFNLQAAVLGIESDALAETMKEKR